jgi:hypothetical protein
MDAKKAQPSSHSPWDELSPALRDAVKRVRDSRVPEGIALRVEELLRSRLARTPRSFRPRFTVWTLAIICASVALIVCCWTVEIVNARFGQMPSSAPDHIGASMTDISPSVWAYSKAARQSPESLNKLLDHQWRQSGSAKAPSSTYAGVSSSEPVRHAVP